MTPATTIVASAPGKVLLAGGYLILDPDHIGLVVSLSARIYVIVSTDQAEPSGSSLFTVDSPQFADSTWKYKCALDETKNLKWTDISQTSQNTYVGLTLFYVLSYLHPHELNTSIFPYRGAKITILADNDYYSQSSSPTYHHLQSLPRFNPLGVPISETNKTGLGSSAALITALTAALISSYSDIDITSPKGKQIIHNLAQVAHCAAQRKVGSGFDIAAAVYGSCIYRRFETDVMEGGILEGTNMDPETRLKLKSVVNRAWDMETTKFSMPEGLRVIMGDVSGGSATPSMVRSVMAWKARNPDAKNVWEDLGSSNKRFISLLDGLRKFDAKDIVTELKKGMHTGRSTSNLELYTALHSVIEEFKKIRSLLGRMGKESSAPIEPESQTELLEECLQVDGVLVAGVPGAGGYDAIFCIIADDGGETFEHLVNLWEKRSVRVCPLLAREERSFGARLENVEAFLSLSGIASLGYH